MARESEEVIEREIIERKMRSAYATSNMLRSIGNLFLVLSRLEAQATDKRLALQLMRRGSLKLRK